MCNRYTAIDRRRYVCVVAPLLLLPQSFLNNMKVEIWSDIQCPFCYIGKRKFEAALAAFEGRDEVIVTWRSFQLNPNLAPQPGKDIYTHLAEMKGISWEQSVQMHQQVKAMAAEAGLDYDFDRTVVANSYDAHRLIQLAKTEGLGDAAEEQLFKAYFTEGKDIGNHAILTQLGEAIGLEATTVKDVLAQSAYSKEVDADIEEARALGIRGVPFFVIDRKYAVSGAQAPEAFLSVLRQARQENSSQQVTEGATCTTNGACA
jgi:protein disulfide-isomerase